MKTIIIIFSLFCFYQPVPMDDKTLETICTRSCTVTVVIDGTPYSATATVGGIFKSCRKATSQACAAAKSSVNSQIGPEYQLKY